VEAVAEGGIGVVPVLGANVASGIGRDTSAVDDDSENHETKTGNDLDDTDNKFDLEKVSLLL
jgi:hypothetical protein